MTQKPGLMTRFFTAARLGLGLALAGLSMGAMAQTPQATLADATACVPKEYVEKTAQGETTYYVVCIKQLDGTRKEVRYTKDSGAIMPPPVNDGKLLDGSVASGDARNDRIANRKIIGKYDKDKQIVLAMTGDRIIQTSSKKIRELAKKIEDKQEITRDDLMGTYIANYIFAQANFENEKERYKKVTESLDTVAQSILKLPPHEVEQIKQKAKEEAQRRWRDVTGSLD